MRGERVIVALALLSALASALTACAPETTSVCVPELAVSPADPRPGRIVTVRTVRSCAVELPEDARWEVRIQPADATIPIARAFVRPDADGSFEVSITVPPTIGPGPAIAHISNYAEYVLCPDGASCAAASVTFEVRR